MSLNSKTKKRQSKVAVTRKELVGDLADLAIRTDLGPSYFPNAGGNYAPVLEANGVVRCEYAELACPECGEKEDLHQRAYEIYARNHQDGPATRIAINNADCTQSEKLTVVQEEAKTAPSRRDTLAIQFHCRNCRCLPVLHIRQHKGGTLMWFTVTQVLQPEDASAPV